MSRMSNADTVIVKATSNIYTVLVFASFLAVVGGLLSVYTVGNTLFGKGWLTGQDPDVNRPARVVR